MLSRCSKFTMVAVFSLSCLLFSAISYGQEKPAPGSETGKQEKPKINPSKIILEHVSDAHEFHFFNYSNHPVSIPLPVILYSPAKGWSVFMSSAFKHGEETYNGYRLLEEKYVEENKLDEKIYKPGKIVAVDASGAPDASVKVYDLSLGRNAVQMIISVILLIWIMSRIAGKYAKGQGVTTAPTGFQNAVEPVITFVRDEVGKSNLGKRYEKYMPFLLTVFFFILINNLIGLLPGTANVTGNIAFTAVLGIISFVVILFSTNKHYWGHIANPPVPFGVKPIMIPVEIMGIFTKPFALIIRLFANMISGHIIILSFIILIFIFGAMNTGLGWGTSPFFIALAIFIYLIEILVAFIQAFIFANLTAVFIGQAFEGSHDEHAHEPGHHDDAVIV
ncbi:F0F1 ATP synthase subunit A [Flavitalea sp. BT771]|uniref:F0F1 ATP synthase subunit A n=1 Tax=Flavitalea sp. BT771 TaxID=3063329 RepID=UPI0026E13760|nr:F0F1 ATP synthase subunit A [Flavitalea sp. BT771]MDO6434009.1 F0F1 ATP synthase subunit A [Flavitalea sp. BT771]MDV6222909.1 F0F1 ATP synthase subunit A [Flavitalea sp. BT771]